MMVIVCVAGRKFSHERKPLRGATLSVLPLYRQMIRAWTLEIESVADLSNVIQPNHRLPTDTDLEPPRVGWTRRKDRAVLEFLSDADAEDPHRGYLVCQVGGPLTEYLSEEDFCEPWVV